MQRKVRFRSSIKRPGHWPADGLTRTQASGRAYVVCRDYSVSWMVPYHASFGNHVRVKAESVKLLECPIGSQPALRRALGRPSLGRRDTGAGTPFGGLFAFRTNPLAGPFAGEFLTALQAITLFILVLAGWLGLPVIGRGHMSSLVSSDEGGSPGSDAQIRAGLVIYRLLRKISADESNILQLKQN